MNGARKGQCHAVRRAGGRCTANAMAGSKFCFFHDPSMASRRTEARRAGGRKNKAAVLSANLPDSPLKNVADVVSLLAATLNQVRRGELDPKFANCIGYLSGILIKALETEDIEARIASLEQAILTQKKQGWPPDGNNEYSFVSDSALEGL
jgi:hypothetical protein